MVGKVMLREAHTAKRMVGPVEMRLVGVVPVPLGSAWTLAT